jgi:A/G-specific adenine glycosylase
MASKVQSVQPIMKSAAHSDSRHWPQLRRALLAWYDRNQRDLPWRKTRDPYQIWISEVMLQQTRVAAVTLRYAAFLRRFPSVQKLASARESSALAEWSGLGYYRRARNLHAAARVIVGEHGGNFPRTADAWRALPGVGRYTAAAIASIAFDEPVAVLDGNVERVLRRLLGGTPSSQELWSAAQELLDHKRPGDFNQAMMELGATVCLPREPLCSECPIRKFCRTRGLGDSITRKSPQQRRKITFALARHQDSILLVRRSKRHSLMPGMWELPELASPSATDELLFSIRHSITITDFKVQVVRTNDIAAKGEWVGISRLARLPLTGLARKILRTAGIIQ